VRLSIFPLSIITEKGSVQLLSPKNMAPVTRRTSFPKVVIERDSDSEQSSSDEEEEEQEQEILEDEENGVTQNAKIEKLEVGFDANRKGKTPITLTLRKVCKVSPFL
jgi:DNA damage-binding protein 2